jgi:hypothetical protein
MLIECCERDREVIESILKKLWIKEPIFPRCTYEHGVDETHRFKFYMVAERRPSLLPFVTQMVCRQLVPGKDLSISRLASYDFVMKGVQLTVLEAEVQLDGAEDMMMLQRNIGTFLSEMRGGQSNRLEECLEAMERRWPERFGRSLTGAMHRFLAGGGDTFCEKRTVRHVARLIGYSHVMRKLMRESLSSRPEARHLRARVMPLGPGRLGLFVAATLKQGEVLEGLHLARAVNHFIPGVREVEGSFVLQKRPYDPIQMLYIEVEKERICSEEIQRLKLSVHADLRARVEQQRHPIFMPRNDEELMRHVVTLSDQLKYSRDLPQVHLSFSEQTAQALSFTAVVLRVRKPGTASIEELFSKSGTQLRFTPELVKVVGSLRRKYPKEATIFRVSVLQEKFFRSDLSVDLHRARQAVVGELQQVMGEFRDYNGGLFSRQQEQLQKLRTACGGIGRRHELLLENYFHALNPHVMRCLLGTEQLRNLFLMVADIAHASSQPRLKVFDDIHCTYATMVTDDPRGVQQAVNALALPDGRLAQVEVESNDRQVVGFLLRDRSNEERRMLLAAIHEALLESASVPAVA